MITDHVSAATRHAEDCGKLGMGPVTMGAYETDDVNKEHVLEYWNILALLFLTTALIVFSCFTVRW